MGKRLRTEAAQGCIKYAKDVLGVKSIVSLILERNKQSIRVAEKNGLTYEKETVFHELNHQVYRLNLYEEEIRIGGEE